MRRIWVVLIALLFAIRTYGVAPNLRSILPLGGKIDSEVEVRFEGERLADTEEVIAYEPGITFLKFNLITNKMVKAQLRIEPNCALGEHHLRLRTATGFSELLTFFAGPFPVLEEAEPNNDLKKAQEIPLNTTVEGVILSEDVDCFSVDANKGQRLSGEVEAIRAGRSSLDARLTVVGPGGDVVADADDTWLGVQDPFVTFIAPEDGRYTFQIRDVTYGGSDKSYYRLHIGTFARPASVFPLGAKAGEETQFTFFSPVTGCFTQSFKLPETEQKRYGLFPQFDGLSAPTPNWVRISAFPNVLGAAQSTNREHATTTDLKPPFALNGIISEKRQENWFSVPLEKEHAVDFKVFARRLHSPLDSVIEVFDSAGKSLGSNDDTAGADSDLKITPSATTNYFVKIRDRLGEGGPDFGYRVEITSAHPALSVNIPEVARNDTQSRQYISVPRGNRFATLISVKRSNVKGPVRLEIADLPSGIQMFADEVSSSMDSLPVVFEAAPDAVISGKLLDLAASGTNADGKVSGHFNQNVELVQGAPNNAVYYATSVDKLAVAVTREAPFKLRIVEPRVPLVQAGSMRLEIVAERATNFDEPIELNMVWNPPGVSSQSEATIPKGATNVFYQLNASASAETRVWKIAVLGHATVEGGPLYTSTQLTPLTVASPYVRGKIETTWLNPGKSARLTVNLQQEQPFEGKAKISLMGLPEHVATEDKEISAQDQEVVFHLKADTNCPPGSQKNLFCAVDIPANGTTISHTIATGGILRIVPPKKTEPKVAKAEVKK